VAFLLGPPLHQTPNQLHKTLHTTWFASSEVSGALVETRNALTQARFTLVLARNVLTLARFALILVRNALILVRFASIQTGFVADETWSWTGEAGCVDI
jgi:hypothetical protein